MSEREPRGAVEPADTEPESTGEPADPVADPAADRRGVIGRRADTACRDGIDADGRPAVGVGVGRIGPTDRPEPRLDGEFAGRRRSVAGHGAPAPFESRWLGRDMTD
ncbi:hypothetical protein [Halohasta salina]|uniref:hypothetical protein n=1 Tax=Halohasta salina TaxID=2961621 RepID=UPI0020A46447|nr:hypothetical protein [Halohasta salina]